MKYRSPSFHPTLYKLKHNDDTAQVLIGPLEKGFGISFANILRRVLMRFTPGASITGVKIKGFTNIHPYSVIPGVKEDVSTLLTNMRNIILKMHTYSTVTMRIQKKGPCIVRGKDIVCQADVKIINPEQYICTLEDCVQINIILYGDSGCGFVPASFFGQLKDTVFCDVIFSPITHVSYYIRTYATYEDLILQVKTNGSCDSYLAIQNTLSFIQQKVSPRYT